MFQRQSNYTDVVQKNHSLLRLSYLQLHPLVVTYVCSAEGTGIIITGNRLRTLSPRIYCSYYSPLLNKGFTCLPQKVSRTTFGRSFEKGHQERQHDAGRHARNEHLTASSDKFMQEKPRPMDWPKGPGSSKTKKLHDYAVLLLLLLITAAQPLALHLDFCATTLELFKAFLGLWEFIGCGFVSDNTLRDLTFYATYQQLAHTTASPRPSLLDTQFQPQ